MDAADATCPMCMETEMEPLGYMGPGTYWARCRACGWDQPVNLAWDEMQLDTGDDYMLDFPEEGADVPQEEVFGHEEDGDA